MMNAEVRGFDGLSVVNAHQLRHDDLKAVNTKDSPEEVKPSSLDGIEVDGSRIRVRLAPASWSVIRLKV